MNSMHSTNKTITEFLGCPPLNDTQTDGEMTASDCDTPETPPKESNFWVYFAIIVLIVIIFGVIIIGLYVFHRLKRKHRNNSISNTIKTTTNSTLSFSTGEKSSTSKESSSLAMSNF